MKCHICQESENNCFVECLLCPNIVCPACQVYDDHVKGIVCDACLMDGRCINYMDVSICLEGTLQVGDTCVCDCNLECDYCYEKVYKLHKCTRCMSMECCYDCLEEHMWTKKNNMYTCGLCSEEQLPQPGCGVQ